VPESQSQHSSIPQTAIESPACPKCQASMMLARVMPGRLNLDSRTFECVKCDHVEKLLVAADPMHFDVLGWLLGELRPPR
jgi:Zn ribbon nucleic-acid-binding protein